MFLPGLLLGLISCWHRGILKTLLAHPSIILMPAFTHFTFVSSTKWCKRLTKKNKEEQGNATEETGEPFITFSTTFTVANLVFSFVASVVYGLSITHMNGWDELFRGIPLYLQYYLFRPWHNIPFILVPILGILLTLISLAFISDCPPCFSCNCSCFSLPNYSFTCSLPLPSYYYSCSSLPKVEYGALVVSKPESHYVLDANNGKPKLVLENEEAELGEVKTED